MLDFEIERSERRCSATNKELAAGESFYSALVEIEGDVQRIDFSEDGWRGAPDGCLGWWKTQVPSIQSLRMKWAPNDVMLHYFERLEEDANKIDIRYVLSLLMLRRRILAQQDTVTDALGQEHIRFHCAKNNREYMVASVPLKAERIEAIQTELAELLYCPRG